MSEEVYNTSDMWLGSVLLCETDARLDDFQVSRNGRTTVMFSFRGQNLSQVAKEYCNERIQVNVVELRSKLNFLRDVIFQSKKSR